jgi:hypothetical protein
MLPSIASNPDSDFTYVNNMLMHGSNIMFIVPLLRNRHMNIIPLGYIFYTYICFDPVATHGHLY